MRNLISTIICGFVVFVLVSCEEEKDVPVTSVTIGQATAEMLIGETVQLSATVLPSDASDKTVSWASSKQSVATISNTGLVTAIAEGTSTITASAGEKSGTCTITVSNKDIEVSSVTLNKTSAQLKAGETVTLTATVMPDNATDKTVIWSTSDASVATISDGVVKAIKLGTATITAKAGDKSATCAITVVATTVTSVTLNKTSASLKVGEKVTLTATVKPNDATDKTVTWTTSNATVASVSNSGLVTAKKVGTATITAKAGDKSATCAITVVKTLVTSLSFQYDFYYLGKGEYRTLEYSISPDDATDRSVVWSSSNPKYVSVDQNGKVTAISSGSASIITVSARDGSGKKANCVVVACPCPGYTVDLGLGTVYWAVANLNVAYNDDDYYGYFCEDPENVYDFNGDYFAWGERRSKSKYRLDNYGFINKDNRLTKYVLFGSTSGSPDGKSILESEDDIATLSLSGKWRIPTQSEWSQLLTKCVWKWTTNWGGVYGKNGYIVTGPNGNSIFLPTTGYMGSSGHVYKDMGVYWSSSLSNSGNSWNACCVRFKSDEVYEDTQMRWLGLYIRPVWKE